MRTKITDEMLSEAVKNCNCIFEVLRYFNIKEAGGSHSHYKNRILKLGLDTSHFYKTSWNKGKKSPSRKPSSDILVKRTKGGRTNSKLLVRALIEVGVAHKCSKCGQLPTWFGKPLTLDVDHINEDWLDDRLENLRFLCPNCHSQFSRNLLGD